MDDPSKTPAGLADGLGLGSVLRRATPMRPHSSWVPRVPRGARDLGQPHDTPKRRGQISIDDYLSLAAPHLHADWRPDESELLPESVDQEPLVREVKRRRDVREKDERGRCDADLCRVEDANLLAAGTDR